MFSWISLRRLFGLKSVELMPWLWRLERRLAGINGFFERAGYGGGDGIEYSTTRGEEDDESADADD